MALDFGIAKGDGGPIATVPEPVKKIITENSHTVRYCSFSAADYSALQILPRIESFEEYDVFAGSGWGAMLAAIAATGRVTPHELEEHVGTDGEYIARSGVTKLARELAWVISRGFVGSPTRLSFGLLDNWIRELIPDAEDLLLEDFRADVFFQAVDAKPGGQSYIVDKKTCGDWSLLRLCRLVMASMADYRPLEENTPISGDMREGIFWNFPSVGVVDPSLKFFQIHKPNRRLVIRFKIFLSVPRIPELRDGLITDHTQTVPFVLALDIGRRETSIMMLEALSGLIPADRFDLTIFEPVLWNMRPTRSHIFYMLKRKDNTVTLEELKKKCP